MIDGLAGIGAGGGSFQAADIRRRNSGPSRGNRGMIDGRARIGGGALQTSGI
jgi:hypothetical protein